MSNQHEWAAGWGTLALINAGLAEAWLWFLRSDDEEGRGVERRICRRHGANIQGTD